MKESIKKKFESIDQSKIKVDSTKELLSKIEKALNGKNEENANKAEALLDKFIAQAKGKKADIFVSTKAEPKLTPTEKKKATQVVKSKLDALMDMIKTDPLLKDFNNARRVKGGGKSDPLIDSERKARESGRRVSKKGWKNQYGASAGGRRYYEYRENRIDRKAPNYGDRPWLEDGGMIHPSNSMHEKFMVVEIMDDGSRKVHNKFPDMESAMMFGALKRNFLKKGSQLIIEDENGKQVYRSFKSGGMMADGGEIEFSAQRKADNKNISNEELIQDYKDARYQLNEFMMGNIKPSKVIGGGYKSSAIAKRLAEEYLEKQVAIYKSALTKRGLMEHGGKIDESTAMVLSQNKEIAHHTEELKEALKKNPEVEPWVIGKIERASTDMSDVTHYLDGKTEYADGGKIKGDTLENVRKDAKSLSRNSKEDMYLVEEKHYEFSNTNDKKIVTQYTVATQEDVDYIKEMPKNRLVVSFKILGKYSNGELKSSEQEVLFANGGYLKDELPYDNAVYKYLEGKDLLIYSMGVKQPMNYKIKNVIPPNRRYSIPTLVLELTLGEERIQGVEKIKNFVNGKQIELYDGKEYYAIQLASMAKPKKAMGDYTNRRNVKLIVINNPNKKGTIKSLTIDKKDFLNGLNKFEEGGKLTKDYTYIKRNDVTQVAYYDEKGKTQIDFKPKNGFWVSKKALVDAGMNETKAKFDAQIVADEIIALSNKAWDTLSIDSGSQVYASDSLQENLADEYQKVGIDKIYKKLTKPERKKVSDILTDENEHSLRNYLALRGFNGEAEYKNYAKMYEDSYAKFGYRSNWNPKNVDVSLSVVSDSYTKSGGDNYKVEVNQYIPRGSSGGVDYYYVVDGDKKRINKKTGKVYRGKQMDFYKFSTKEEAEKYAQSLNNKYAKGGTITDGEKLPEDLEKYFVKTRFTKQIKIADLIPLRARPTGIANAEKYMRMAYEGKMERRKPITIYKSQKKYRVLDGNSTYAVAKENGWQYILADVVKNPNMNNAHKRKGDVFSTAKAIRKEGESWQDALQRAKLMK
jgi:hypothetical protein